MSNLTSNGARSALYALMSSSWTETIFAFDDEPHGLANGDVEWALFVVRHEQRDQDGQSTLGPVGSRRYMRTGRIMLQFSIPEGGGGSARLDALDGAAKAIFEGVSVSGGMRIFGAEYRETGTDGKWQQAIVEAEFDYQEIK